jgi:hypothetical protein
MPEEAAQLTQKHWRPQDQPVLPEQTIIKVLHFLAYVQDHNV